MDKNGTFVPLDKLALACRPNDEVVAWENQRPLTWEELKRRVSGLMVALQNQNGGRWLVSCQSSFAFLTSLLVLWATDRVAVLAPNQQPGTLRETAQGIAGTLSDSVDLDIPQPVLSPLDFRGENVPWPPFNTSTPLLELFTSGSMGDRKSVSKTLAQLIVEVNTLEHVFGERVGDSVVFSTVSHQHIYGLLFRVLWPLCARRPFDTQTHLFWEDLFGAMAPHPQAALVTSPTHLERMDLFHYKGKLTGLFSSGGKLRESTALIVSTRLGEAPIEVFGSTETGGIGWRQQTNAPDSQNWRPLPGVFVSQSLNGNNLLEVRSPFVGLGNEPALLGDVGTVFSDGCFRVEGRADRIVKVAEKRLSLDDLEQRFNRHPYVKEVRVIILGPAPEQSRVTIGAVIQLSDEGNNALAHNRKDSVYAAFRKHLLNEFDPTLLPRRFRFVESFPVDSQGKTSLRSMQRLFDSEFDERVTCPKRIQMESSDIIFLVKALVPENLGYFEGHFPGIPIVPGIVQIKWVVDAIEEWWGQEPIIDRLEAIKFKRTMRPSQNFSLQVKNISTERQKGVEFIYRDGDTIFSSGRLMIL